MAGSGKSLQINKPDNAGTVNYYALKEPIWCFNIENFIWNEANEDLLDKNRLFQTPPRPLEMSVLSVHFRS